MKTYVINLDRSTDRLAAFKRQAAGINLQFERVSAVDARELPEEQISRFEQIVPKSFRMSPGEFACLLSHQDVWQKVIDSGDAWAFVCEDDIHFKKSIRPFLENDEWLPVRAEVVNAFTCGKPTFYSKRHPFFFQGRSMFELKGWHPGTTGYFISAAGCQKLLHFRGKVCVPSDNYMFDPTLTMARQLTIYQLFPALCVANPAFDSLLDHGRAERKITNSFSFAYKLKREIKRPFVRLGKRMGQAIRNYEYGVIPYESDNG